MRAECVFYAVRTASLNVVQEVLSLKILLWLMRLVAGLSPRRPGFDSGPVYVSLVDKMVLGEVSLQILRFCLVIIIPRMLHIHLHLHVTLPEGQVGQVLGIFKKERSFRYRGALDRNVATFLSFERLYNLRNKRCFIQRRQLR